MSNKVSAEQAWAREAMFSRLPMLPKERPYNFYSNFNVSLAANICTWLFLTGCWIGMLVPVPIGILISFAGVCVPMLLNALIARIAARYGLDWSMHSRATFGTIGGVIVILALIPTFWGWASIPTVMFGRVSNMLLSHWGVTGIVTSPLIWSAVCLVIGFFLTYGGPTWQQRTFKVAVPTMLLLLALVTYKTIDFYGWAHIMSVTPPMFVENPRLSMMIAFEVQVGCGFSWLANQSQWARLCKTERAAYWPNFISWGPLWAVACIPGILLGAVAGFWDPVEAMGVFGGVWIPIYMILLLLANPSSLVLELYFIALSLRSIFFKLTWKTALIITTIPVILLTYLPGAYDAYGSFVGLIAVVFGVFTGVWVTDLFLRKFELSVKDIYEESPRSAYYYWSGINWCAIVAVVGTAIFSFWLYNPVTAEVKNLPVLFNNLGAGIPSAITGAVVYYILFKIFIEPKKVGLPEVIEQN